MVERDAVASDRTLREPLSHRGVPHRLDIRRRSPTQTQLSERPAADELDIGRTLARQQRGQLEVTIIIRERIDQSSPQLLSAGGGGLHDVREVRQLEVRGQPPLRAAPSVGRRRFESRELRLDLVGNEAQD